MSTVDPVYSSTRNVMDDQEQSFGRAIRRKRNTGESVVNPVLDYFDQTEEIKKTNHTFRYLTATGLVAYSAGMFYMIMKENGKNSII